MKLERLSRLAPERFLTGYLAANKPVIVTDAMDAWPGRANWTPERLRKDFGEEQVQVYGDLFMLLEVTSFARYLDENFGKPEGPGTAKYMRWYSRHSATNKVPWADSVFQRLRGEWSNPYFAPRTDYLLPFCPPASELDPNRDLFPARGLYLSGRGARTRLHFDPWSSNAFLCQFHGEKRFTLYSPDQAALLSNERGVVDIENPKLDWFPRFPQARPDYEDSLAPGEIIFIPRGWFHHFTTVRDSVSLTWNFVHRIEWAAFTRYLLGSPSKKEADAISYFLFEAEGRRPLDAGSFVDFFGAR